MGREYKNARYVATLAVSLLFSSTLVGHWIDSIKAKNAAQVNLNPKLNLNQPIKAAERGRTTLAQTTLSRHPLPS
jgi:hypothetical protein